MEPSFLNEVLSKIERAQLGFDKAKDIIAREMMLIQSEQPTLDDNNYAD